MCMDELRTKLLHEIMGIYGPNQGQSIGAVIIPAFVSDFKNVVEKSDCSDEVSEEYMTEDKRIHLVLYGRKTLGKKGLGAAHEHVGHFFHLVVSSLFFLQARLLDGLNTGKPNVMNAQQKSRSLRENSFGVNQ